MIFLQGNLEMKSLALVVVNVKKWGMNEVEPRNAKKNFFILFNLFWIFQKKQTNFSRCLFTPNVLLFFHKYGYFLNFKTAPPWPSSLDALVKMSCLTVDQGVKVYKWLKYNLFQVIFLFNFPFACSMSW